jgi:uncharacterized protein YjiS (DUF1127 family)
MAQHVRSRYWARRAERATIGTLHALDDRTLKDIGLDRSEIESVASSLHKGGGATHPRPLRGRPSRKLPAE